MADLTPIGENLRGRRITLGVTGSIAAFKAADLASQLVKHGADVRVILTRAAQEFIGAATFRALTLHPVVTSVFDEPFEDRIGHIELGQNTDLVLVAPATADIIAKMAHGLADDALAATLLATTAPVMLAPAMNTAMLDHPATRQNMEELRSRGVRFVDPGSGILACRTEGPGRLAEVVDILKEVQDFFDRAGDFRGLRVVITAGATREPLDPVRFISNRSSGKMGYALAAEAAGRGAEVVVVSGVVSVPPPPGVSVVPASTTQEMLERSREAFENCDLFIAAAAPADYSAVAPLRQKRKKSDGEWTLQLKETPDILAALAKSKKKQVVIGFAAESDSLLDNAREKLLRKNLDLIVANDVTSPGAGFEVDTNRVTVLCADGTVQQLPLLAKREVARRILDMALPLLANVAR